MILLAHWNFCHADTQICRHHCMLQLKESIQQIDSSLNQWYPNSNQYRFCRKGNSSFLDMYKFILKIDLRHDNLICTNGMPPIFYLWIWFFYLCIWTYLYVWYIDGCCLSVPQIDLSACADRKMVMLYACLCNKPQFYRTDKHKK